jgi:23S rRNA-/tRNA-specific pseudouridylate synthase
MTTLGDDNKDRSNRSGRSNSVPESVLQYERQLRKAQHAKKAGAMLEASDLKVIFSDDYLVAVNKPPGVLTVPGIRSHPSILDLVHARYAKCAVDGEPPIEPAHMIVHRLDMDTSGIVLFGRTKQATKRLHQNFRERDGVDKEYEALVVGHLPPEVDSGTIELPLQRDHTHPPFMRVSTPRSEANAQIALEDLRTHGWKKLVRKVPKPSATEFTVLERGVHGETLLPYTRVRLQPVTGRTHQLRVHCAALGYPIVGDPAYGHLGEASPCGGIADVLSIRCSVEEESKPTHEPPIERSPGSAEMPRCPLEVQQQWTSRYVTNERPMCLHAVSLSLNHPVTDEPLTFQVKPSF